MQFLITPVGVFGCDAIVCALAPIDLQGYWTAGAERLFVTAQYVPWAVLSCRPLAWLFVDTPATWICWGG